MQTQHKWRGEMVYSFQMTEYSACTDRISAQCWERKCTLNDLEFDMRSKNLWSDSWKQLFPWKLKQKRTQALFPRWRHPVQWCVTRLRKTRALKSCEKIRDSKIVKKNLPCQSKNTLVVWDGVPHFPYWQIWNQNNKIIDKDTPYLSYYEIFFRYLY